MPENMNWQQLLEKAPNSEHLMCEILDWGDTPASRRFSDPLPGSILMMTFELPISGVEKVRTSLRMLNGEGPRPNPIDIVFGWSTAVKYRLYFLGTGTMVQELPKSVDYPVFMPGTTGPQWEMLKEQIAHMFYAMYFDERKDN